MSKPFKSIAIDGPSGAGKSSVARLLAKELGFLYVDTGAIYRTVGLSVRRSGADPRSEAEVFPLLSRIKVEMSVEQDGLQHMYLNGEDVTDEIRLPDISRYASDVSAHPCVRDFLLSMQRETAREHNVIMDGRDIGTVVLPGADLKLFLTASAEERARRRFRELRERGQDVCFDTVLREINERDKNDTNRAVAPLCRAEDALLVDTTQERLPEVAARLQVLIKERLGL
jgi:cytidylate kinase